VHFAVAAGIRKQTQFGFRALKSGARWLASRLARHYRRKYFGTCIDDDAIIIGSRKQR
jgi:hypothetical protein